MSETNKKEQKLNTQSYKGARDSYPDQMRLRNYIFNTWRQVAKKYGYEEYDFPILEPLEIFAAKTGEEIVRDQLFTLTDKAERKLAIRPELTPGTVRMIAAKYKELLQPIRWFMIGNNWRFEKPQKGRGREFYQLEVNIFGEPSFYADFEIFQIIVDLMTEFGADATMYEIKVNDRKIINALLNDKLKLDPETQIKARRIMDKRDKVSEEDFTKMLLEVGLEEKAAQLVKDFMKSSFEESEQILGSEVLLNNEGYIKFKGLLQTLKDNNLDQYVKYSPSIIRGFDYSDGLVYEVFDINPENKRSMFGGERFDKLINIFGEFDLPATGFAMGDITLEEFLRGWNLLPELKEETEYLITVWNQNSKYFNASADLSRKIRNRRKNCILWLDNNAKLEKQIKYADRKGIKKVAIIGENEIDKDMVTIKDLVSGKQETITIQNFLDHLE